MPSRTGRSGSSGSRNPKGARASVPRDVDRNSDRPPTLPPSGVGQWVVPGVLGVALLGAVLWFVRIGNRVPAEPAAHEPDATTAPGGSPTAQPTPPQPLAPPPPPPPAVVPPQQPTENVEVTPVHPEPTSPDPRHGHFTLAEASAGLPAGTTLKADIVTSMGTFTCDLLPDRAPNNVANFVGLARGLRDFWDPVAGAWVRRPFYDGSVFHRVIPDFMIQGGDILRSGRGDPGYEIADENISPHDAPGLLCMANHGPNTAGGQFFITEQAKPHLDSSYSIFGRCQPTALVGQIARTPRGPGDRPVTPVWIRSVRVHR